jgi:hypothetical protein
MDAHHDLQNSPREPQCELLRVIVGLMFASDGTQLTIFSNNKLWPVYLAIGNESKYRRTKPSCQSFEHIAYLETVSRLFTNQLQDLNYFHSFQMPSKPLQRSELVERDPTVLSWRIVRVKCIMLNGISSLMMNLSRRTCMVL